MIRDRFRGQLRTAITATLVLMLITGVLYPALVTGVAQIAFPQQANGSLVTRNGTVVGSALIGQKFIQPWYFHPRPSAAGDGYDGTASGGSNRGPTDRKLADTLIAGAVDAAVRLDGVRRGSIPPDMVTSSASGLDPHITPANAALQVARVARARGVDSSRVAALVAQHVEGRTFGFLGEPRVNVLQLNLALDRAIPRH
jgi:K+-transporting ATPase ATPase C chain